MANKKNVQTQISIRMYPDDLGKLSSIKEELDLPWPSVIKVLIAEHEAAKKEK